MRIGIDFDNTIACYDGVFHAVALERGLIAAHVSRDKNSVRDVLNGSGRSEAFTELQGYVYGARMDLAAPYAGVVDFVRAASTGGHDVFVVSHKTRHPLLGPRHDLHAAARGFLSANGIVGPGGLIPDTQAHFEVTKEEKLARAVTLEIDVFIDDLPEILAMPGWPETVRRVLFDPDGHRPDGTWKGHSFERHANWAALRAAILTP